MLRIKWLVCLLAVGLFAGDPAPLRVGVSIFPLKSMVEKVIGDQGEVFACIPAGTNPHLYEPLPSIIRRIQGADIFFGIASEFDGWIGRFRSKGSISVYLKGEGYSPNPHIWLSLRNAEIMVRAMARSLSSLRPEKEAVFNQSASAFIARLRDADREISSLLLPYAGRSLFLWHPSWNYFAADYHLRIAGVIESGHGDEPSVRDFQKLVRKAKEGGVRLVVVDLNVESRAAQALAREINGTLVRLDALGDPRVSEKADYLKLMLWNAQKLAEAFAENPQKRK